MTRSNEPRDEALARCGLHDARLDLAAQRLAERHRAGERDLSRTSEILRSLGEPHVWPRTLVASGRALTKDSLAPDVERWRREMPTMGKRRCGAAIVPSDDGGEDVAAFVSVDPLADLAPLPTRTHVGSWLKIDATLLVPAASARVVVLGAGGRPRSVPATFEGHHVRATFAPDRQGRFKVQVLADVGLGPQPVLEAVVFADVEPFEDEGTAPGESAAEGGDGPEALARMVLALRREAGLRLLTRDRTLDRLALEHARAMKTTGRVGHDVGDGDPKARADAANVIAMRIGENVAHARDVVSAHRALYASPGHRENLLRAEFDRFGVAVAEGDDGSVWVAELFTQSAR